MSDKSLVQRMKEVLKEGNDMSYADYVAAMVKRGIMNEKGEVIVRMPEPPEWPANGAPKNESSPAK